MSVPSVGPLGWGPRLILVALVVLMLATVALTAWLLLGPHVAGLPLPRVEVG